VGVCQSGEKQFTYHYLIDLTVLLISSDSQDAMAWVGAQNISFLNMVMYRYTLFHKKSQQYIYDHNSGKTRSTFIIFALL